MSDRFHDLRSSTFGGIPCGQYWCDFLLWETVLNDNPQCRLIVELGTWQGGFSHYLLAQARARGMAFRTFDITSPDREIPNFEQIDIWNQLERVGEFLAGRDGRVPANESPLPLALFCDNGEKPRELELLAPLCPEGSVFLVHDWGTEMLPELVPGFLEELYGDLCDEIGSITRVFRMAA